MLLPPIGSIAMTNLRCRARWVRHRADNDLVFSVDLSKFLVVDIIIGGVKLLAGHQTSEPVPILFFQSFCSAK